MKTCDLSGSAARLALAMKTLTKAVDEADEHWNDDASRRFHETYLLPLDARMREALEAVRRLEQILASAERECGPA
jgi:uncharacterized protein YukE